MEISVCGRCRGPPCREGIGEGGEGGEEEQEEETEVQGGGRRAPERHIS